MRIRTSEATSRKVAGIVREKLDGWFGGDGLVFDPIVVIPRFDFNDEEYLHIYVIYDGEGEILDSDHTLSLPVLLRNEMTEDELPERCVLCFSYVEKSEWDALRTPWSKYNESARFYWDCPASGFGGRRGAAGAPPACPWPEQGAGGTASRRKRRLLRPVSLARRQRRRYSGRG